MNFFLVVKKKLQPVEFALRYCWILFLLPDNAVFDSFMCRALVQTQMETVSVAIFVTDVFYKSIFGSRYKNVRNVQQPTFWNRPDTS